MPAPRLAFGFNANPVATGFISAQRMADLAANAGATMHRVGVEWRWVERNPDEYSFGNTDALYNALLARGIKPLFVITHAPWWTWDEGVECDQFTQDCLYPPNARAIDQWKEFVALLAVRYPEAAGLEIWNEPNLAVWFKPFANAPRYAGMLASAYDAIKAANPDMKVISAGLSNTPVRANGNVDYPSFLDAVYRHGGLGKMDAVGFHPYPGATTATAVADNLRRLRQVKANRGDSATPLWMTELGLSTTGDLPTGGYTEEEQATGLTAVYNLLSSAKDVEVAIFHTLMDSRDTTVELAEGADPFSIHVGYGLLHRDLKPKPAYCALAALRGKTDACSTTE